jgi:hypothetical protein
LSLCVVPLLLGLKGDYALTFILSSTSMAQNDLQSLDTNEVAIDSRGTDDGAITDAVA